MRIAWAAVVVVAVGSACGGARATVSTRAAALSAPPAQGPAIVLERARIVVERVRLTPALPVQQQSSTQTEVEDDEVGTGPFLLDLSGGDLTGSVSHAFDITAPPGDYTELKIRVHPDDANRLSIIIDGTAGGSAFTFSSSLDEDQRQVGDFTIDGSAVSNITLSFDTSLWFSDGAGSTLDPAAEGNRSRIENNIKSSIEAFEDDDHDGHDDAEL